MPSEDQPRTFGDVVATVDSRGVGEIRLSRPERLNAVTGRTFLQLEEAARWVGSRPECRAVVLSGEGRSFCAGLDLHAGLAPDGEGAPWSGLDDPIERDHAALRAGAAAVLALRELAQPVIAAVRGHAVGAGFALAAAADIRVCSPDARFGAVFVRLGVSAGDLGLSWFLPRIVGPARAADLCLTGETLDADQALGAGLVTRLVDDPVAHARELASEIAAWPRLGVTTTKSLLAASHTSGLREHLDAELATQVAALATRAHARARQAVLTRQQPTPSESR